MNILGIYREPAYSPGRHTSNDARILRLVGQALERLGFSVHLAELEEARSIWKEPEMIFSMCQGPDALAELNTWRSQGAKILNDPRASLHTYRDQLCQTLAQRGIPFPDSLLLNTAEPVDPAYVEPLFRRGGAWLKRADVHAMQKGDVVWIENGSGLQSALLHFSERGLQRAVLQEHLPGDEVKFYGVRGGRFFWPYYPNDCQGYPFDENILKKIADDAAKAVGVSVYGGDAIISPEGKITLIDVNDWPSFAPCRGAAAMAIAHHLKDLYDSTQNRRKATSVSS